MSTAAAIVAGGRGTRMGGRAKAFLSVGGRRIIDRQLEVLGPLFPEIVISADDAALYAGLGLPVVADAVPGQGPLAGILAVLEAVRAERVVVVACDMPYLSAAALALVRDGGEEDVIVPVVHGQPEPLFARYARHCAGAIRARLTAGERKVSSFFGDVSVRELGEDLLRAVDPRLTFLHNCNTPEDLL